MSSFRVENSEVCGRFAVAAKDLEAGELFFEEFPFVIGPKPSSKCLCLECYRPLNAVDGSRCSKCSWPLCEKCNEKNQNQFIYHQIECELFCDAKCKFFNLKDSVGICMQLDCITPLRVILKRENDLVRWENEVNEMEDHREKRFDSDTWKADEQNIVKYLLMGPCKLSQRNVDGDLIQKVIGILEVNSFEAKSVGYPVRCLFPKISMLSHSCTPNTTHAIHPSNGYRYL
jgi:hypothetical protein